VTVEPKITFETAGASDDERLAYRMAVAGMLQRCAPLPFTDALGGAVAGRPFTIRLLDNRKLTRNLIQHGPPKPARAPGVPSSVQSAVPPSLRRLRGWAYETRTAESVRELSNWSCVTSLGAVRLRVDS
jgi:hypothetical protein